MLVMPFDILLTALNLCVVFYDAGAVRSSMLEGDYRPKNYHTQAGKIPVVQI